MSNLEFIANLVERAAVVQVNDYTGLHDLLSDVASSYRKGHSTVLKVPRTRRKTLGTKSFSF